MKLIHISDLHLGKRVNEFSMIEDQEYILKKIINVIDDEKADGVLIAGDVYDKSIASDEAVRLLDDFLTKLAKRDLPVFMISGNHDSATKLGFASGLIEKSGIHISPEYANSNRDIAAYELSDGKVSVDIYMLPFVKPAIVRAAFRDEENEISSYTDACKKVIEHMNVDDSKINILVAHQFVIGAEKCESEDISVGGTDAVAVDTFDAFDYVALGHIHGPQQVARETIRYCGTPLKYSFSEMNHTKSVTVIEVNSKDDIDIKTVPLVPKHDMREIKGTYDELMSKSFYEGTAVDDYLLVTLTDEDEVPNAMANMRVIYKNIMKLHYDNKRTRENKVISKLAEVDKKSELELFMEFFEMQNNQTATDEQCELVQEYIEKIKEGK